MLQTEFPPYYAHRNSIRRLYKQLYTATKTKLYKSREQSVLEEAFSRFALIYFFSPSRPLMHLILLLKQP